MLIYISIFVVALAYYFIAGKKNKKAEKMLMYFMLFLALFVGFGDMIGGYDRYIYCEEFDDIADTTWGSRNYTPLHSYVNGPEYGYFYWNVLISYITTNRYIYILITTLFIYFLVYKAFKDYIDNYPLACILFLAFLYYFTMTYVRQLMAIGIAWQGVKYLWEENKKQRLKFWIWLILAATFHDAILIFGAMFFIPTKKYSKKFIIGMLLACLAIGMTPLPNAFISSAGNATGKEGNYADQDQGFRIEYVLEVAFFVWVLFKNYNKIENDRKTLTFLNMCFVLCAILMTFMRFGQGGRFGWSFFIGIIYMFTKLCDDKKALPWMKPLVITVCFALFFRITYAWSYGNRCLLPYKTFFTNGYPSAKDVYEQYEYDEEYEYNKFYRPAFTFIK